MQQMGWAGTGNGLLLSLAAERHFDAFITVDRGIEHQQNIGDLQIPVVILLASHNRLRELEPLVSGVISVLSSGLQKRIYRVSDQTR